MTRPSHTLVAALVTAAALAVPCAAWYVTGSRAAEARAAALAERPLADAREEATRLARRIAERLEALRHSESRRSVLDYRGIDRTDGVDCSLEPGLVSPLAEGPTDPLIWAHFEIDEVGQLTLPTLARPAGATPGRRTADAGQAAAIQRAILEQLECAATERLAALRAPDGASPAALFREAASPAPLPLDAGLDVGPLLWHAVSVADMPALVALREVTTPTAVLAQGFVVRRDALVELVEADHSGVVLRPGAPAGPAEAELVLDDVVWTVAVDPSSELAAAQAQGRRIVARFRRLFGAGLALALAAGAGVVGVVAQTERLARDRARFAALAAHELRTPLAGLRLHAEMLADRTDDPARVRAYGRRIAGEAERLSRVVTNVLAFTRLEHGAGIVRPGPGDLGATVSAAIERLRPTIEAAGARLVLDVERGLPLACFDDDAVRQMLDNLVDNAEKYSRRATERTVRVAVARRGGTVELTVEDEGPGIPPEARRRIFRPFRREVAGGGPAGLGLGLALVRELAEAQRASVECGAAAGGGARFAVRFPAAGPRNAQRHGSARLV